MNYVVDLVKVPPMRVYKVATFYTMFNWCIENTVLLQAAEACSACREPVGKHFDQVCTTTPCMLRGRNEVLKTAQQHLGGLHVGDTTKDGKFTVKCLGACSKVLILAGNDDCYICITVAVPYYSYIYPFGRT